MNTAITAYAAALAAKYKTGATTEHSFRSALQTFLDALLPQYQTVNEPKRTECGAPDFALIARRDRQPHAYIEAKDLFDGDLLGLKPKQNKPQFDRYKAALARVAFTDYLTFQFFANGAKSASVTLLEPDGKGGFRTTEDAAAQFIAALAEWADCPMQPITTPSRLAEIMAEKARLLAAATRGVLASDSPGEVGGWFKSFRQMLIADLTADDFADILAQTIAYGMFAARIFDLTPEDFSRQEAAALIPESNPFLRKLFQQIAANDLDPRIAWIIDDLADAFAATNIKRVLRGGNENVRNDPLIHFYENFLSAYDPALKKSCGVFYTPEPVVRFIVRMVDAVLKRDFGLADGLADSSRIGGRHRVQILDPATGTGTFLAETVRVIKEKFAGNEGMWPGYVEEDLKPRLHGFELLMAPYTIAHLKLAMAMGEAASSRFYPEAAGCRFSQRLSVYLTNSLEDGHRVPELPFAQWLSDEANGARRIKQDTPVMVMLGNPPYSVSSSNKSEFILNLLSDYKEGLNEKKLNLDDDYIKFIRLGQNYIDRNGSGVLAFITNNSYLDGLTHRRMRQSLMESFDEIYIVNLHGNSKRKETAPDGGKDENVFDIMVGTAIAIFVKRGGKGMGNGLPQIHYLDLWGKRKTKFAALEALTLPKETKETKPEASCGVDGTKETKPPASCDGNNDNSCFTKPEASSPCFTKLEASSPWYNPEGEVALTHGNLPHWHQDGKIQFVTFRLADSLPQNKLESMMAEREDWIDTHPKPWDEATEGEYHTRFSQAFDRWLDAGYGSCALKDPAIAKIVEDALLFFDGQRYRVHDYVVMSNHVHVLLETVNNCRLEEILRSWKTFTAREINKRCGQSGKFWHHESFDRMIRDAGHYGRVRAYIQKNVRQGGVLYFKETIKETKPLIKETKPPASCNGNNNNSPLTKLEASSPCFTKPEASSPWLEASSPWFPWQTLEPKAPHYFFVPKDFSLEEEYNRGIKIDELFAVHGWGAKTERDAASIHFTRKDIEQRVSDFCTLPEHEIREKYSLGKDARDWSIGRAKNDVVAKQGRDEFYKGYNYRPFDIRWTYYTGTSKGFMGTPGYATLKHFTFGDNIGLLVPRQCVSDWHYAFVTDRICDVNFTGTAGQYGAGHVFPLYRYEEIMGKVERVSNLNLDVVRRALQGNEASPRIEPVSRLATLGGYGFVCGVENQGNEASPRIEPVSRLATLGGYGFVEVKKEKENSINNEAGGFVSLGADGVSCSHEAGGFVSLGADGASCSHEAGGFVSLGGGFDALEFFAYCYAVLHSPTYRERYKEFLKIDFPRIPLPIRETKPEASSPWLEASSPCFTKPEASSPCFTKPEASSPWLEASFPWFDYRRLVALGRRLIDLHLMRVDFPNEVLPKFPIVGNNVVEEVRWETGRVYINATQYFDKVPEEAFNFFIGGYQPAQKWLKDRKGRTLTNADITHYRRIVATLSATAELMAEIG